MPNDDPDNESVTRALRVLREAENEDAGLGPAPELEAHLLTEVRGLGRARKRRRGVMVTVAAAVFVAVSFSAWRIAGTRSGTGSPRADGTQPLPEMTTAFLPLVYSNVPMSNGQLIRTAIPRRALAAFGLASGDAADDPTAMVLVDVVVGDDGLARAVRFVRLSRR